MKKGFISVLILTIGMICLAGCGKIKENKVRQFAETFAGYAAANSIDSVKAVYPTAKFGAVAPLSKDSIEISDKEEGKPVTVKYGADKWIEVEENEDGSFRGELKDVLETGANDVYIVKWQDREVLIPAIKECILSVDTQKNEMKVHLLEGLLD